MSYDAIVFDSDGVLVEPPARETLQSAASTALDRVGLDADPRSVARNLFEGDVDALAAQCRRSGVDLAAFCQRAASASFEAQRREIESGLRSVYDDVRALWDLDRPLGLVSDNQPQVVQYLLRRFDLEGRFETVRCRSVSPRELRWRKPDTQNLEAALTDLDADDALYVGDTERDVEAARRVGIDSALVSRSDREAPSTSPDYEIGGLDELPEIVV